MKLNKIILGLGILTLNYSCGVPQADYEKLQVEKEQLIKENEEFKKKLDDCKFGAEKIIALVEKAYSEKNYTIARENIQMLYQKHPESSKNKDFKDLLVIIQNEELVEQKRREEAEKERIRLENLNNTGIWEVSYYVDEFGERTKESFIRNTDLISGTFSNTATQNSDLNVKFLISDPSDISIMLYEYARNNPVKAYSSKSYQVLIQDKDGERHKLRAENYSDRLSFSKATSRQVHNILMKGGAVKFRIYETETPTTQYDFTIRNSDWYENAYAKLKETKNK
jgi:hypothetical protein